jgi:hypothetical protein
VLGVSVRDLTGGYRCLSRDVLERVEVATLRSQGYVFNIELTFRALQAGFRVTEVPIVFRDRTVGESKISLSIAIEALWLVPSLRFPKLRRSWPARTSPLAHPAARIEVDPPAERDDGADGPSVGPGSVLAGVPEQPGQRRELGDYGDLDEQVADKPRDRSQLA